ncbi:MAG: flippase [Candidatus Kapabacteria bacterium]|nr:flippase [Candidatus Kapabacteria bacterium]MDW8011878.1 flippase [Bacteroidota bacterium]
MQSSEERKAESSREQSAEHLYRIVRNAAIAGGGNLFGQLLGPVIGVITTRALGAELYGLYSLLVQWGALLAEVVKTGWAAAIVRFVGVYRAQGCLEWLKGAVWVGIGWVGLIGTVVVGVVIAAAEPLSSLLMPNHLQAAGALRFYAPAVLLTALYGITLAVLTGFQQQRLVQLSYAVVGNITKLLALLVFLGMGWGIYAALGASLLQDAVVLGVSLLFVLRVFPELRLPQVRPRVAWRELLRYAATLLATSLLYRYTFQLDILVLGLFRTAAEVGMYAAAVRLQPLLALPTYALGETFNPVVAGLYARGEREQLRIVYSTVVRWSLLLTFPLVLPCAIVPSAVLSVFGAEFQAAAAILPLLSVGTWIGAAFGVAGYVLNMAGKPQVNLLNGVITAVLNVALFWFLIPPLGMWGAALTYALVNVGMAFIRVGQVWWILRLHPCEGLLGRAAAVVALALGAALLGSSVEPWLGALLGLAIFGVMVRIGLGPYDRAVWEQWRARRESRASD